MPDVQEVFRMATQKVRPDPGALERQQGQQRRRTTRRKAGAYALAAALTAAIAVVAVRAGIAPPSGHPWVRHRVRQLLRPPSRSEP